MWSRTSGRIVESNRGPMRFMDIITLVRDPTFIEFDQIPSLHGVYICIIWIENVRGYYDVYLLVSNMFVKLSFIETFLYLLFKLLTI